MAHTLTFSGYLTVTVNGTSVTSPYTLKNGDTVHATSELGVSVNGDTSIDTPQLTLTDTDITLASNRGAILSSITINYAESTPTISFKHRFKNDTLIGTGTYKFRRYSVEEPVVVKSLEDSTWAEISQVSANKQWDAMGWKVGDTKTITLNGNVGSVALNNYQCKVYILGFDHNSAKEGSGISFGMLESTGGVQLCLYSFAMNTRATNVGGWKACNMRKTILGSTDTANGNATPATTTSPVANTLMAALPADLRAVLKPITKYTDNVGNMSTSVSAITSTVDYLPLLSEFEVFGSRSYANGNEKTYQEQYQYYKNGKGKIKYKHTNITSADWWWLRSPYMNAASIFCDVSSTGNDSYGDASNTAGGVAPAFLV